MSSHCHNSDTDCCGADDVVDLQHLEASNSDDIDAGEHRRTVFDIGGLCCQSEVDLIEDALQSVGGIEDYTISIAAGTLTIYHDGDDERIDRVVEELAGAGLKATARRSVGRSEAVDDGPYSAQFWVIVAGVVLAALGALFSYGLQMPTAGASTFAAAIGVGGYFVFRRAWSGVRRRQFNIPILVTIAVIGAGIIGEWFEAATVVILFAFAEWLESRSMARARREIGALMQLSPQVALRIGDDGTPREVAVESIEAGDRLRIRPGDKIPVDAVIDEGRTEVDESMITGESVPVVKHGGDSVYSGTVNGSGALTVRATQPASKSTLAHIIDAIEDARENQSPTEQFIDRFAAVYTPVVVAVSALVAVIPPLFFGAAWVDWFYRALVFLVIACPCALVISTPIANVAGMARAARQGLLVKGGKFLEQLGKLDAIAFDKTGTVTVGRPHVEVLHSTDGVTDDQLLMAAARAEADSEHHIGRAIVDAARHRMKPGAFVDRASDVQATVGRGIEATIDAEGLDNAASARLPARVGTVDWLASKGVDIPVSLHQRQQQLESDAHTVVAVALGDRLMGLIALRDALRPEAADAIGELRSRGVSPAYLLTGDNAATADAIGTELGLHEGAVAARLLPKQKVARIEALRDDHEHIAMVGDGVNDAPALAGASVGVAMGAAGTDVALETSDVALMGDNLGRLADAVDIGRKTTRVIYQNIAIALGLKAIFLVLAIMGVATLWMAIAADMGASLIVIFNAIRLLRSDDTDREVSAIADREATPQVAAG